MKIQKIVPAILEKNYEAVCEQIEKYKILSENFSKNKSEISNNFTLQIDVCDGVYVETKTWLPSTEINEDGEFINDLKYWNELDYEADLMVDDAKKYLEIAGELGFAKAVIHIKDEEKDKVRDCYDYCISMDMQMGIASKNINNIIENLEYCDYVQVMGIKNIGKQRQDFDEDRVLADIQEIKNKIETLNTEKDFNIYIQMDGSMGEESIKICKDAGAEVFAVGSYLKNSQNIGESYRLLNSIAK
jgi:ribulose-phosphate 3-epimerase